MSDFTPPADITALNADLAAKAKRLNQLAGEIELTMAVIENASPEEKKAMFAKIKTMMQESQSLSNILAGYEAYLKQNTQ